MKYEVQQYVGENVNKMTWYTDGSVATNPGFGGSASTALINDEPAFWIGEYCGTCVTNNYAESYAALMSLRLTPINMETHIISDSRYVLSGLCKILNSKGREILSTNEKIWEMCLIEIERIGWNRIWVEHVKGHSGNVYNTRSDQIAEAVRLLRLPHILTGKWEADNVPNMRQFAPSTFEYHPEEK